MVASIANAVLMYTGDYYDDTSSEWVSPRIAIDVPLGGIVAIGMAALLALDAVPSIGRSKIWKAKILVLVAAIIGLAAYVYKSRPRATTCAD